MHSFKLLLRLLAFIWCLHSVAAIQRILHGPVNTTVRVGQTALLRCQVADQVGGVLWTKDGFGLGTDRKIPHFKRYSMVGTISKGEYNLEIENVSVDDDGAYECQILWANNDNPNQVSAPARLSVIAEPMDPTLGDAQDSIKANEDAPVRVKCMSKSGRPASRLVWVVSLDPQATRIASYLNNASDILKEIGVMPIRGQKTFEFSSQEVIQDDGNGFYTSISEIDFVPSKEDDGRYLSCIALHPTYEGKSRVASAGLSVRYKPKVQVQLDESASDLTEGGRAVFRCLVDAKPRQDLSVSWQGMEDRLKATNAQTAVVEKLKMEDHLTQISCLARNSVGLTKSTANLTVKFAPRLMSTAQTRVVHAGESVSFHCEAIGNPAPRILWYRAGASSKDDILAKGHTLTLDSVSMRNIGQYECVASRPPVVSLNEPGYLSSSKVLLSCDVHSKPNANRISWFKNGKLIDYTSVDQNRFTLREFSREFGIESRLSIDQIKPADYGVYNCTAWNEFGSRSSTVEVVEQTFLIKARKTAFIYVSHVPWYIWAGLFGLIFLLILICCVRSCCCCCNRSSKRQGCCTRRDNLKPSKFSDCSDVTVRCEALDHDPQPYFTEVFHDSMYATSPPLDSSSELLHKDYISIPQNNPDLDFLPPPVYGYYQQPYGYNNTMEYSPNDNNGNPSSTFSGYNSPIMNQEICVPVYNPNRNNFAVRQLNVAPLETLPEVDTPTADNILLPDNRAASRVSTHV